MRHKVAGRRLSRTKEHRLAMRRNLVASLFQHETISTTIEKAKEVRPFAEKLITLAKKGNLAARRRAISLLGNREIMELQDGEYVKTGTIIGKLFSEIGPRYLERPGGYTRIIRLSLRRLGDNGQLVLLQLIGADESIEKETKQSTNKRSRRAAAAKAGKKAEKAETAEEEVEQAPQEAAETPQEQAEEKTEEVVETAAEQESSDAKNTNKDKAEEQESEEPK